MNWRVDIYLSEIKTLQSYLGNFHIKQPNWYQLPFLFNMLLISVFNQYSI